MRGEPSIERLLLDYDSGGYLHSAASTNHALKASIISVMGVFKSVLFINIKMFYKNNIILMENVYRRDREGRTSRDLDGQAAHDFNLIVIELSL